MGFLIDPDKVKYKVMRDTELQTAVQNRSQTEERIDQYRTWAGLKIGLKECHRIIEGITGIA